MTYKSLSEVPELIRTKLEDIVFDIHATTFAISLSEPEVIGGALARYSRAPTSLKLTLINEFLDENGDPNPIKGQELMDRVLNAFGDESVGELQFASVGIEEVTQLETKEIEDRRIGGSPIEKSTRYVEYNVKNTSGNWPYLVPEEVKQLDLESEYKEAMDSLFQVYSDSIKPLKEHFIKQMPKENFKIKVDRNGNQVEVGLEDIVDNEKSGFKQAYRFTIRCAALDVARGLLPASTLTNLGVTGNGRYFTNLITYLRSSSLQESREQAHKLISAVNNIIPTFIKRHRVVEQWQERNKLFQAASGIYGPISPDATTVTLVPDRGEIIDGVPVTHMDEVAAACLFPYQQQGLHQLIQAMQRQPTEEKQRIIDCYTGSRKSRRDRTGRSVETGYPFTFDILSTFGEYRDLERHRMLTQQRQLLTTAHGFSIPEEFEQVGFRTKVEDAVEKVERVHAKIRKTGRWDVAQYATCFNHKVRFYMGMNLRELQHLTELRSGVNGHHGYRSIAMEMARLAITRHPWIEPNIQHVNYEDPDNKIARAKEQANLAYKSLKQGIKQ